ncbi:MAG: polyamine aminopropyltransferase [Nitrospiraceae bacterium]|nr:polyamine aminopropyltransferase [Nitrospiraceae bacterium]
MIKFFESAPFSPVGYCYEIENILYKGKSRFQEIAVLESPDFGRMLLLDGTVQMTEADEFFYHEMLTHPVMHANPAPRKVIVIGGGDGGVVREVLKHESVQKVYLVEIDEKVIEISRKFFPSVSSGLDDPRVEIRPMDGAEFVRKTPRGDIDVIIVDSTDIIGFARSLYTKNFFSAVKDCLSGDGFFVTHSESLIYHKETVRKVQQILKESFPSVDLYTATIATYPGNLWAFAVGSVSLDPREARRKFEIQTRYYDDEIHAQSFVTPKFYRKLMDDKLDWGLPARIA